MATAAGVDPLAPAVPSGIDRNHKYVLLLGTLSATVTYSAGLSPPGGFLSSDSGVERHPVLLDMYPQRNLMFFYCNATAFVASLVVVALHIQSNQRIRRCTLPLRAAMTLDFVGLIGAFAAAGGYGRTQISTYVVALVAAVLSFAVIKLLVFLYYLVENLIHDVQEALRRYLQFERLEHQIHEEQQIRASELANDDAYQILWKSRMYLLLLGILSASITYQAGLNPPGGFWQDNAGDGGPHNLTGGPVLHNTYPRRYLAFLYCNPVLLDNYQHRYHYLAFFYGNTMAFLASLVIIVMLLLNRRLLARGIWCYMLRVCVILELVGLMSAFAAGCYRKIWMVDVLFLFLAVIISISLHVALFVSGTARGLVQRLLPEHGWPQVLKVENDYVSKDDEFQLGISSGTTREEPFGLEISAPMICGAFTVILFIPVMGIVDVYNLVRLLVPMLIVSIGLGIWHRVFAPLLWALARPLRRRCIPHHGATTPTPREQLVLALCHGASKVIHSLCSGTWMLILVMVIWMPSLRQNLKVKFKVSKISAVWGLLLVGAAPTTATTTIMDTPGAATVGTPTIAPSGTSIVRRRRDQPLVQAEVEPRPRRNRRPNRQVIGGDWHNS